MNRAPAALVVCAAWAVGAAFGIAAVPGRPALGAAALVGGAGALVAAAVVRPLRYPLAVAALLLGIARAESVAGGPSLQAAAVRLAGTTVQIAGTVADDPRDLAGAYELLVAPMRAETSTGMPIAGFGDVLVVAKGVRRAAYGDEVQAAGKLTLPADAPGFDRRAYLAARGAVLELRVQSVSVVGAGPPLGRLGGELRSLYRTAAGQLLPAPQAAVLEGVVLGVRSGIPPPLNQALIATGLIHLLVLSGLKVAVVARLVAATLRTLLGRAATWPAIAFVALYALIGGGTPAAVRAAAMGGLVLGAAHLGRPAHVWTSLAVTGAAMIAWQPELAWNVGYQLSFLGTAAIILLTPPLMRRLGRVPEPFREPFAVTCAAQIGTAPLVAADFHVVPLLGPVANALVLPFLPALVGGGVLLAPLALVPALGHVLALPVAALLTYLEQVAYALGRIPGAAVAVPALPAAAGLAYYLALGGALAALAPVRVLSPERRRVLVAAGVIGPLLITGGELAAWSLPRAEATVLAVGDGQAVLLRGPGGFVLAGGGPGPARLGDELGQLIPPWQRDLAGVLVTGDSLGEVGGFAGFDRRAGVVGLPSGGLPGSAWRRAVLALVTAGARYRPLTAGASISLAGLRFDILSPERGEPGDETGWGDLAFRAVGPDGRALCDLGELGSDAQRLAAAHLRGRCTYLVFDARAAPDPDVAAWLDPDALVMSCGASARTPPGLPAGRVRRTDQEGDVTVAL